MKKAILLILTLGITACSPHDERYYALHPKALQAALAQCPEQNTGALSCTQLQVIARRVNKLAYLLRVNQQAYGQKIIALQEARDRQRQQIQAHPERLELHDALDKTSRRIEERLAVVQWLQSPEH